MGVLDDPTAVEQLLLRWLDAHLITRSQAEEILAFEDSRLDANRPVTAAPAETPQAPVIPPAPTESAWPAIPEPPAQATPEPVSPVLPVTEEAAGPDLEQPADLPPPDPEERPVATVWHSTRPPGEEEEEPYVVRTGPTAGMQAAIDKASGVGLDSITDPPFARDPIAVLDARLVGAVAAVLGAVAVIVVTLSVITDVTLSGGLRLLVADLIGLVAAVLGTAGGAMMVAGRESGRLLVVASLGLDLVSTLAQGLGHVLSLPSLGQIVFWAVLYYLVVTARFGLRGGLLSVDIRRRAG